MQRRNLILLIVLVLLGIIIFLGYNIYNYIDYVPRAELVEESNIIENKATEVTLQTFNITP